MDAQASSSAGTGNAAGGTVETANRAAVAKTKHQTQEASPRERYELRDPFSAVTYRTDSIAEMIAEADQLGSTRFTALAPDGKRTPITKSGAKWHRGKPLAALPPRPLDADKDEPEPRPAADGAARTASPARAAQARKASAQMSLPLGRRSQASPSARIDIEAERAAHVARLEDALRDRYVIRRAPVTVGPVTLGQTEYRFRGDPSRIAFTESTFRLATGTNNPSVARSMVDVAQARNWHGLRVTGSKDFRRLVWMEATVRGVKAVGYEPNPSDLDLLKRERDARQTHHIEPTRDSQTGTVSAPAEKSSGRGGGRKAVIAAIEAILVEKNVPEAKRVAVLAAATEQLAQRAREGQAPKVKIYGNTVPSQRPAVTPVREVSRSRDRVAPPHVR